MLTPIFTADQFTAALQGPLPVLIFWGMPGCGACQETKPVVRRYANHYHNLDVYEVNVNLLEELANQHRIQYTPTLMIFAKGQRVARRAGAMDEKQLERWVTKALAE